MLNTISARKENIAFRAVSFGEYGTQIVFVDARDDDLLRNIGISVATARMKFVVDHPTIPGKRIALAKAVAERHVRQPSPAHVCVGFRNGSPIDCRASNLYWATQVQLTKSGNVTWRRSMARQPARIDVLTK